MQTSRNHVEGFGGRYWVNYDFAVDGGAVGVHDLPLQLPANSLIIGGYAELQVGPDGDPGDPQISPGGGFISVGLETVDDLLAADSLEFWGGPASLIPLLSDPSTYVRTSQDINPALHITIAPALQGQFNVVIDYRIISEARSQPLIRP